jgi:hypothetical protein
MSVKGCTRAELAIFDTLGIYGVWRRVSALAGVSSAWRLRPEAVAARIRPDAPLRYQLPKPHDYLRARDARMTGRSGEQNGLINVLKTAVAQD